MIRRPPRSTQSRSSAASDVYKRQSPGPTSCSCAASYPAWSPSGFATAPCTQPAALPSMLAAQEQEVGPGDQGPGDQHQLHPDRVHLEVAEGEQLEAHLLGAADAVLAAGAGAVVALEPRGVSCAVGEDRLESVPIRVGEGELGAGMGPLAAHDQARALRPAGEVDQVGGLGDLTVYPRAAILGKRGNPALIGDPGDRLAYRLGQVETDREADPPLARPVQQPVRGPGGVEAQDDLGVGGDVRGQLLERLFGDLDLVGHRVGAGVAGPQQPCQRLPAAGVGGAVEEGEHRVESETALERARGALLLGARLYQRRVEVDEERAVRLGTGGPGALTRLPAGTAKRAEQLRVASDRLDGPPGGGVGGDRAEERFLVAHRA